jgi:hypothetical protein
VSYKLKEEKVYNFRIKAIAKGGATKLTEPIKLDIGCGNEKVVSSVK